MFRRWLLWFLGVLFCSQQVIGAEQSHVVVLDEENFDDFLNDHKHVLVKFHATWCGYCRTLAPEYEAAALTLSQRESPIKLAEVDAQKHSTLGERYQVNGYPTLLFFINGKHQSYTGPRQAQGIVEWLDMMTGPVIVLVGGVEDAIPTEEHKSHFYGEFISDESELYRAYREAAEEHRQAAKFHAVVDPKITKEWIHVERLSEEPYKLEVSTPEAVQEFVTSEQMPLFAPINHSNYRHYFNRPLRFVWVCASDDKFQELAPVLRKVARNMRKQFSIVFLNTNEYEEHANSVLEVREYPAIVVHGAEGRFIMLSSKTQHHKLETEDLDANIITQWLQDVLDNKIPRTRKSEAIPIEQGDPIRIVVGNNFEEVVYGSGKDVLLEVYAPWCFHCQNFEPIYSDVAEKLKSNQNLIVAKMDGSANESPVEEFSWSGYPAIFFLKAGQRVPIKYEGGRTLNDLLAYLEKNMTQSPTTETETVEISTNEEL